jgi:hypothetical protein
MILQRRQQDSLSVRPNWRSRTRLKLRNSIGSQVASVGAAVGLVRSDWIGQSN